LAAGIVNIHSENAFVFKVSKLVDLNQKIIPLFEKNPIRGLLLLIARAKGKTVRFFRFL
jgi:hypothetical protein